MEPTVFPELAWLLVVQSNAIPSRAQLGNTCREWYWHVRRLEHWRSWQVVMADFFHVSKIFRLSVLRTDDQIRDRQSIRPGEVTAREQHHPGITHTVEKIGGSLDVRDFFQSGSPSALARGRNTWWCRLAAPREYEDVRGWCHGAAHRARVGSHQTHRERGIRQPFHLNSPDDWPRQSPHPRWRNWDGVFVTPWRSNEKHLNALEFPALLAAIARCFQNPQSAQSRRLMLKNSSVVLTVAAKGRSCS